MTLTATPPLATPFNRTLRGILSPLIQALLQSHLSDMSSTNAKPRKESSALVPGVTLFEKTVRIHDDGSRDTHHVVRGSAQIEGQQKIITRAVEAHGLEEALRQVCEWRYEHAPGRYDSAEELYEEARERAEQQE